MTRKEAIKILEFEKQGVFKSLATKEALDMAISALSENKGEWILDETDNSVECDKCGCQIYPNDISHGEPHFCPNCGADMRGRAYEHRRRSNHFSEGSRDNREQ